MTKTHILVLRVRGHTSTATVRAHSHLLLVHETTRRLTPRPVISASVLPSGAARPRRPGLLLPFPVAALHPVALVDAAHLSAREVPARAHRLERVLIRNHPERRRPRVGILLVRGSGALPRPPSTAAAGADEVEPAPCSPPRNRRGIRGRDDTLFAYSVDPPKYTSSTLEVVPTILSMDPRVCAMLF